MDQLATPSRQALLEAAEILPLEAINVGQPLLFQQDAFWPYFARLRREAPVHYCAESDYGAFWSITRYKHIMKIEANPEVFSSDIRYGGIALRDPMPDFVMPMFIAMDEPAHMAQRSAVQPIVAADNLARFESLVRERAQGLLDALPIGETFNWVQHVSIELTNQLLATLFDFPWEDRHKLTRWSDVATAVPGGGIVESDDERKAELTECLQYFMKLWQERKAAPPRGDLLSLMAHAAPTRGQGPMELLGNLILLIVGGNDTTRNSITGGLYALNKFPGEYTKLLENPALVPGMVPEIIRWQTPLAHMRRTATRDFEFEGQAIREGDRVAMWYVSGNFDEEAIPEAGRLIIDRPRARRHLSFGFGPHRCLGERLADMQLRVVWEEILKRFGRIEVTEEPVRVFSPFVKGYSVLNVRIPPASLKRRQEDELKG